MRYMPRGFVPSRRRERRAICGADKSGIVLGVSFESRVSTSNPIVNYVPLEVPFCVGILRVFLNVNNPKHSVGTKKSYRQYSMLEMYIVFPKELGLRFLPTKQIFPIRIRFANNRFQRLEHRIHTAFLIFIQHQHAIL